MQIACPAAVSGTPVHPGTAVVKPWLKSTVPPPSVGVTVAVKVTG